MSSFFNCLAYDDLVSTIRLADHVVFLALEDSAKKSAVHLTLNPFQTRILAKYLFAALAQINFADLADEKHFGDLAVHIELDQPRLDHEEYALALPF